MKLLIILNNLDIGGAQNYTISLMNEFVKLGHSVSLRVLSADLSLVHRIDCRVDIKVWSRKKKLDITVLKSLRKEIIQNEYSGIISSYDLYHKIATLFLNNLPPTIYPLHSTVARSKKSFFVSFLLFRFKLKHEKYLTSIDSQTQYLVCKHYLRNDFFHQIYNGIDTCKFAFAPDLFDKNSFKRQLGICESNIIILMVAGYREEKRHIDALNAFVLLQKEIQNVTLLFLGDNRSKEREDLVNHVNRNHIKNVILLNADNGFELIHFFWSSNLFTLTSNKVETFPISVLEAMACGLPCVLTNTGGARDIIKDFNGLICEANNIENIKNAWKNVILNLTDYNKEVIRQHILLNFSIQKSAEEYLKLLNSF